MHVLMVISGGIVMLGLFLLFGHLWGGNSAALVIAAKCFVPVWFVVAVVNLWIGVHSAGYSLREELPILILVFIVPAAVAGILLWRIPS
nr:hypothetical protein [Luteibacter rhizovicinus]